MLIDTHSHIYVEEFMNESDEVVQRALENRVEKIILPNIDSSSIDPMLKLTDSYPNNCFPTIGLHPASVNADFHKELEIMESWLKRRKFVAIGEIGMDLYWDKTFHGEQADAFSLQLRWAVEYQLPVIIHIRNAFDEVFEILEERNSNVLRGVFHSFTGTVDQALKAIGMGFYIGVNGIVTFKNAGVDKVISSLKPENLLLETDSPYLAPIPFRGKRNESSFLVHIAQKIADIHSVSVDEIKWITTKNAIELFKL